MFSASEGTICARCENESRSAEEEKILRLSGLELNLFSVQTTTVKRVKLVITKVTIGILAITCLSGAVCFKEGRPREIVRMENIFPLGW